MNFGVTREKSSSFELIYFEPKIRVELELEPGLEPISIWNDKELISIKRKIKIIHNCDDSVLSRPFSFLLSSQ